MLEEVILIPEKPTRPTPTQSVKSIQRRAKNSEREIARRMQNIDGADPAYRNIASSTGRIGHISGMRVDGVSLQYAIENKNRALPSWLVKAWILIQQKSVEMNKQVLLHIEPSNGPKDYAANGLKHKSENMAILTQTRHEKLIGDEKRIQAIEQICETPLSNAMKLRSIKDLLGQ